MSNINKFPDRSIIHCVSEAISDADRWGRDVHEVIEWHLRTLGVATKHMAESTDGHDLVCLADGRWVRWTPYLGKNSVVICD
jgi:hypothetical protein